MPHLELEKIPPRKDTCAPHQTNFNLDISALGATPEPTHPRIPRQSHSLSHNSIHISLPILNAYSYYK